MITLLLSVCASPQIEGFNLDGFLAAQDPPGLEEVLNRLGPVPAFDSLLDPDREVGEIPAYEPREESFSEDETLQLEEIQSWSEKISATRRAGKAKESVLWAALQTRERQALLPEGHPLIARSLGHLSYALYSVNRNREARDMTLLALDMELDEFGRLHGRVRESLLRLSARLERLGNEASGEVALRHALDIAILCEGPNSRTAGRIQSNLGSKLSSTGKYQQSVRFYERSMEIFEELEGANSNSVAVLCSNLSQILINLGRKEEALDLLTQAVDIHRELDQMDSRAAIVCLLVMSTLCPPTEALEYMEEAMDVADRVLGPEDPIWPTALNQYGWGLVQTRNFEEAEPVLRRALDIQTKRYGPQSVQVADVNNNLAGLMRLRGQELEALELYKSSFEIKRRYAPKNHPSLITGWNNLAVLHYALNQYDEAEAAWQHGLDLCLELLPSPHEETARMLTNYGTLLFTVQRHEESEAMLRDAVEMRRELLGKHRDTGTAETSLAQTLFRLGQEEEAQELLNSAEEIHREGLGASGLGLPSVLRLRALLQRQRGETQAAYRTSREAFEMVDAQKEKLVGTPAEEALFAKAISHGSVAALHAATVIDIGEHQEALIVFERARGRMLLDLLRERHKDAPHWKAATVTPPAELQANLDPEEQIRAYFWSNNGLLIYDVGRDDLRAEVRVWGRDDMAKLLRNIERYAELLADANRSEGQEELGQELVSLLWPETPDGPRRWIILPDGPLQKLPFEALPIPGAEAKEFVYASSSTLYQDRCRIAEERTRDRPTQLLAVGDPAFPESSGLAPLGATRSEVENAARLVQDSGGESHVLLGKQATLQAIEERAGSCTVLHLATHGQAGSPEDPLSASLALATGKAGDSALSLRTLFEDWQAQLPECELVVLSACETQKATKVGDSLMALSWGFFYAGAPTVLATLWKVDDRASALLMGRFYEYLLNGEGNTKLAALTKAKEWLRNASRREIRQYERELGLDALGSDSLRSPGSGGGLNAGLLKPYSDPAYWAGFVLLGSPE